MPRFFVILILLCAVYACGCGAQPERDPRVAEILAAPVPAGVDAQLWRELTAKLAAIVRDGKTISTPPVNLGSTTTLAYDDANGVLSWPYYFSGDYDQNGVVSVSDLTPLALHLGASVSDVNTPAGVCDGDGNLQVTLADLTPIGVNLGRRVEGYRVYSADSEAPYPAGPGAPNGSGTQLAGTVLFTDASGDKSTQRLAFSFDPPAPTAQTYYWVRPFDGSDDGTPSNFVAIAPGGNPPPLAALSAIPPTGPTPLRVQLSAAASHDEAPGSIVKYEWDLDGDGDFEYDGGAVDSTPMWYYAPGTFTASVRVTDNTGLTDTRSVTVDVTLGQSWHVQEVDETFSPTCKVVNSDGNPGVFYTGGSPYPVLFRRASNAVGSSWGVAKEVFPGTQSIFKACTVQGHPAAAIRVPTEQIVTAKVADNPQGSTWGDPLPSPMMIVSYFSFAEVSGLPAITTDFTSEGFGLNFSLCSNLALNEWSPSSFVSQLAAEHDLKEIAGFPAVAYHIKSGSVEALAYSSATDASGANWQVPVLLDYVGVAGNNPSLVQADGRPAVAYYDAVFGALKYIHALDPEGRAWGTPLFLDTRVGSTQDISVLPDGRPCIAYFAKDGTALRCIVANDAAGRSWSAMQVIVEQDMAGSHRIEDSVSVLATSAGIFVCFAAFELNENQGIMTFAAYY